MKLNILQAMALSLQKSRKEARTRKHFVTIVNKRARRPMTKTRKRKLKRINERKRLLAAICKKPAFTIKIREGVYRPMFTANVVRDFR